MRRIWRKPELRHQGHGVVILAAVNDLPVASPSDEAELHLDLPARRRDRTGRNLKSAVLTSVCDRLDNRPVTYGVDIGLLKPYMGKGLQIPSAVTRDTLRQMVSITMGTKRRSR